MFIKKITHRTEMALLVALLVVAGCRTVMPSAKIDLSESGWMVRHGQAVWRAQKETPEIAGELLVATNLDGRVFVQFTKTPFPFVTAQTARNNWQIEFPAINKRISGRGEPWQRFVWLQLPRFLTGITNSRQWAWQTFENSRWSLRNRITGESLEGFLAP